MNCSLFRYYYARHTAHKKNKHGVHVHNRTQISTRRLATAFAPFCGRPCENFPRIWSPCNIGLTFLILQCARIQIWGRWGPASLKWECGWHLETRFCSTCILLPYNDSPEIFVSTYLETDRAKFGCSRPNRSSISLPEKNDQPLKVTQGHRNRHWSIGYLWLPVSVP